MKKLSTILSVWLLIPLIGFAANTNKVLMSPKLASMQVVKTKIVVAPLPVATNDIAAKIAQVQPPPIPTNTVTKTFKVAFVTTNGFYVISNPPPSVSFVWVASTDPTVTNYNIYWGVSSGQYTNFFAVGNVTTATMTGSNFWVRGVTYYVAATAMDSGLESAFSNEVTFTLHTIPGAPGMSPLIQIAVQSSPDLKTWGDEPEYAGTLTSDPSVLHKFFRLHIAALNP